MSARRPLSVVGASLACALVLIVGAIASPIGAEEKRALPAEAIATIEAIRGVEAQAVQQDVEPPCCIVDASAPAVLIPQALERLGAIGDVRSIAGRIQLRAAKAALEDAWAAFTGADRSADRSRARDASSLRHLNKTLAGLRRAASALGLAGATLPRLAPDLQALRRSLTSTAARIARDAFAIAEAAGVPDRRLAQIRQAIGLAQRAADSGFDLGAIVLFDVALTLIGNGIEFDIDEFEQNIRDALEDESIGFTYAIGLFDTVYVSDGVGEARIAPDGGLEAQDPGKEMHLASVSKTLTAIIVLWLLEQNGLTPDAAIGTWLPDDWARGAGVDTQTFRDFLTHETGFTQKGVAKATIPTYANLQAAVAINKPADTTHNYNNSNFALFRVIIPRLAGFDLDAFPEYEPDDLTAGLFIYTALSFYEAVDARALCHPDQPNRTLYYSFPHNGTNGLALDDFSPECGAYGFYMTSDDLGAVLAGLTATDDLLSDASYALMKDGALGFFDPANGYFWGNGGVGLYHNHGGDWEAGIKGLDACVMLFPNGVSAALQINSIGGDYPYQCELLRAAFDGAWVPS